MRVSGLLVPLILTLSLSACSGTWEGMKADAQKKPLSAVAENVPPGYTTGRVLKPLVQEEALQKTPAATPAWNDVGDYRQWISGAAPPRPTGTAYNSAVTVFPIDGAGGDVLAYNNGAPGWLPYGAPAQTMYFAHGSAKVKAADKTKLARLARNTKKKGGGNSFTVVGHASHRVDRVRDPVRRKMINLAMAQKRANAVTHELKKAGLKPAWVKAVSRGDEDPNPAPPHGLSQEAADRRVDLYMDGR
jgi:outer membrane protein OmpA-like peptidoglycan-associated protein